MILVWKIILYILLEKCVDYGHLVAYAYFIFASPFLLLCAEVLWIGSAIMCYIVVDAMMIIMNSIYIQMQLCMHSVRVWFINYKLQLQQSSLFYLRVLKENLNICTLYSGFWNALHDAVSKFESFTLENLIWKW